VFRRWMPGVDTDEVNAVVTADFFVSFDGFGCWASTIAVLFVGVGLSFEIVMEEDSITGAAMGAGCATAAVAVGGGGGLDKRDEYEIGWAGCGTEVGITW